MRLALASLLLLAAPAAAQRADSIDTRVERVERQLRAVQRRVFPGGQPVEPEGGAASAPVEAPASSPVADLTARVDAIEKSLAALTGQVETQANRLRQLEDAVRAQQAAPPAGTPAPNDSAVAGDTGADGPPAATVRPAPAAEAAGARTAAARAQAVSAIEMPATGDAGEDQYSYGYRLYAAGLYPEAQAVLKQVVAKYPRHRRASFAQNLLGRAYLDEGKPGLASVALYDSYQKFPKGERAPESLYWLGQALTRLDKKPDACRVYDELASVYPAALAGDLRARVTRGRADAGCAA